MGDFNAEPDEPTYARMRRGRLPVGVRRGQRRASPPSPGRPGCRRRRWTRTATRLPRLHLGPRRRPVVEARLVFDRPHPDDPTLYPSDHLGHRRAARGRLSACCDSRTAATGGTRRRTRIAALAAALAVPGCDGVEFDVRAVGRRRARCSLTTSRSTGSRVARAGRRAAARELEELGVPSLADALAVDPAPGAPSTSISRASTTAPWSRSLPPDAGPGSSNGVVSSFVPDTLERIGGLAPAWPRWLNTRDLSADDDPQAVDLGLPGHLGRLPRHRRGVVRGASRAAGLDVAAWTRPPARRPTVAWQRLGVDRGVRRGCGARRLSRGTAGGHADDGSGGPRGRRGGHDRWLGIGLRREPTASAGSSSWSVGSPGWAPRHARPGVVRAQGGTPATVALGRWSIDFYRGQQAAYGTDSGFRELGYLILAVTEDDERAGRERVAMQHAAGLTDVRWLTAAEAAAARRHAGAGAATAAAAIATATATSTRRATSGPTRSRCRQRGRRAARADGVHRAPHRPSDGRGRRGRDDRRCDRDRPRAAHRRAVAARGRARCAGCGSRPGPRATRSPCWSRTRRSPSSGCRWCSTSAPGCTGGSRRAGCCSAGAIPTSSPARRARSTGRPTSAIAARLGGLRADHARSRAAQDLGRDDRLHAGPPADPRAGDAAGRVAYRRVSWSRRPPATG